MFTLTHEYREDTGASFAEVADSASYFELRLNKIEDDIAQLKTVLLEIQDMLRFAGLDEAAERLGDLSLLYGCWKKLPTSTSCLTGG